MSLYDNINVLFSNEFYDNLFISTIQHPKLKSSFYLRILDVGRGDLLVAVCLFMSLCLKCLTLTAENINRYVCFCFVSLCSSVQHKCTNMSEFACFDFLAPLAAFALVPEDEGGYQNHDYMNVRDY